MFTIIMSTLQAEKIMFREADFPGVTPPLGSKVGWGFTLVPRSPCLGDCGLATPAASTSHPQLC